MNHSNILSTKIGYLWVKKYNLCSLYKYCFSKPLGNFKSFSFLFGKSLALV